MINFLLFSVFSILILFFFKFIKRGLFFLNLKFLLILKNLLVNKLKEYFLFLVNFLILFLVVFKFKRSEVKFFNEKIVDLNGKYLIYIIGFFILLVKYLIFFILKLIFLLYLNIFNFIYFKIFLIFNFEYLEIMFCFLGEMNKLFMLVLYCVFV